MATKQEGNLKKLQEMSDSIRKLKPKNNNNKVHPDKMILK